MKKTFNLDFDIALLKHRCLFKDREKIDVRGRIRKFVAMLLPEEEKN